jgi:hypothetical protein
VIFGKWMNVLPTLGALAGAGALVSVVGGMWYYATPKFFKVGYMPTQPGSGFNHQLHAGKLGMDCRYCHTNVEESPEANIPPVSTCFGCHAENHVSTAFAKDENVAFVREAFNADEPIAWRRVHKVPDYVRNFPHHAHVNAGISCYSCHGNIMGMPVVFQHEPLSMGWCLECHVDKKPEQYLVPKDKITNLDWVQTHLKDVNAAIAKGQAATSVEGFDAQKVYESLKLAPPANCGACHY